MAEGTTEGRSVKLPDVCRVRHGGNEMSERANQAVHQHKLSLRLRILRHLKVNGPSTCEATALALGMRISTASARFCELKRDRHIESTGESEQTTSGCFAEVFRVVPSAKS